MAASFSQGGVTGQQIHVGDSKAVITAAESNVIKASRGKVAAVIVWGDTAGTSCTVTVYDDPATTNNSCFRWATAQGLGTFALQMPMANGIYVVVGGTLPTNGGVTIVYQ